MSNILDNNYISERISHYFKQYIVLIHCFHENNIIFITSDDKVFGLGDNDFGRLGFGDNIEVNSPKIIPELCDKCIQQFIIGYEFILALNNEHHIYGWGRNDNGQLGRGYKSGVNEHLKAELISELNDKNIVELSCGEYHCLALTRDGVVYGWGDNEFGQIGCGNRDSVLKPMIIEFFNNIKIKSIYCSNNSSFVITTNDEVYSWGFNGYFNLGHNIDSDDSIYIPRLIDLKNVKKILGNNTFTYFLTNDGFIHFCGKGNKTIKVISNGIKLQSIEGNGDYYCGKCDDIIYEVGENFIIKTEYKTVEDYFIEKFEMTVITLRVEASTTIVNTNDIKLKSCNDYEVIEKIGNGGSGEVYKVLAKYFSGHFAVKIVPKNDKIQKELEILKNIENDYCVKYIHSWIENDYYYIQMNLYKYDLKNFMVLKESFFKQHRDNQNINAIEYIISCEIFNELLSGLDYLHSKVPPIIHRDFKPANVLVSEIPENGIFCKICDFGLSIKKDPVTNTLTKGAGTAGYMAPEGNSGKYYTKSDIYSLGLMAIDMFHMNENLNLSIASIHYQNLHLIVSRMAEALVAKRPTAKEILNEKADWLLNKELLNQDQLINHSNADNENSIFYKILNLKIQDINKITLIFPVSPQSHEPGIDLFDSDTDKSADYALSSSEDGDSKTFDISDYY